MALAPEEAVGEAMPPEEAVSVTMPLEEAVGATVWAVLSKPFIREGSSVSPIC